MPLAISTLSPTSVIADLRERRLRRGTIRDRGKRILIGFVNNMPDAAVGATEQQFARLLEDASGDYDVQLNLFTLETMPREPSAREAIDVSYRAARELRVASPDAVLITGAEPRAPNLRDEPYWRELAGLMDWAEARALSTLFSCLAGHAAVLHRDGIARRRAPAKISGLFQADVVAAHELVEGLADQIVTPHSRHNGLVESELAAAGYSVLTRSREAGVDIFVKETHSLQVFLHGHPEYDGDTLAREFRRDALRFLKGESAVKPNAPRHYFPAPIATRLDEWFTRGDADSAATFPREALQSGSALWRATGTRLIDNWLGAVARRKAARLAPTFASARWGG
jgi:homoserine O-succinyltransferase